MMNSDPFLRKLTTPSLATLGAMAGLALAGCGSHKTETVTHTVGSSTTSGLAEPSGPTEHFQFDSLGSQLSKGGSNVIYVFKGVKNIPKDKEPQGEAGTYMSGQTALAACITPGRLVKSVPREGEMPRQSDEWVGIAGSGDYATVVYTKPSEQQALEHLKPCKNAP